MTVWWRTSTGCGANADSDGLQRWLRDFLRDVLQRRGLSELLADPEFDPASLLDDPRSFAMNSLDMISMASRAAGSLGLDRTGLSDLLLARRSFQGWLEVMRRSLQADDSQIGFYSSGSTGSPAMTLHTVDHLLTECQAFEQVLNGLDVAPGRLVSTVPSHHIYGFIWSQLLPAVMSLPVYRVHPAASLPTTWVKILKDGDVLICTPDLWQLLLQLDMKLPDRFIGISSAGALPTDIARAIRQRFPQSCLLEIYGSTESAGVAYREQDGSDYRLLPYWQLQQDLQTWKLQHCQSDLEVELQDNLLKTGPETIQLLGRRDAAIKINGHNVQLSALAEIMEQHSDVAAAVINTSGSDSQRQLHMFLALKHRMQPSTLWCQQFNDWMNARLGNVPPPASVVVGASLPRSSLGKVISWQPESFPRIEGTRLFRSAFTVT